MYLPDLAILQKKSAAGIVVVAAFLLSACTFLYTREYAVDPIQQISATEDVRTLGPECATS